ncbi:Mov34/MPN/PAD-1 family protein [Edaphobacter aggregans]|uniref:Mov34/MPN/PAD-1 family protein n=1 Tax=Edaphobacter aggregans TaxID=570835 RepID=UPI00054DB812|nr:Mov34/MPN/PAD-1 family protein [Edaphobacter aggregans]
MSEPRPIPQKPETAVSGPETSVRIDSEVTRRIRQHARSHPKTEVCGVLIGDDANRTIDIRASIEALNAAQAGTHVTFTQDAWEEIYRIKDKHYPDERIVGWYHSHPGFGVFLSEHDLFIQQNFFSSPGQVAWVYDPQTDEEGCFGWVSGEVHRLPSLSIVDRNDDGVERTPKRIESSLDSSEPEEELFDAAPARKSRPTPVLLRSAMILLTHLTVLLIGFAIAYFLYPQVLAVMIDPATGEVIVRDGHALLPYLDGRVPLPAVSRPPQLSSPATPPAGNSPGSPAKPQAAPPANPSTPERHQ